MATKNTNNTNKGTKKGKGKKSAAAAIVAEPVVIVPEPVRTQMVLITDPKKRTPDFAVPTVKTDTLIQGHRPAGLQNNRAWVRAALEFAANVKKDTKISILYVHVRTPNGGSEFRPMGNFTYLPSHGSLYIIKNENAKRPEYTYIGEGIFTLD